MKIENLGNAIKRNREKFNLTQEMLAEHINVSSHYIYELEKGLKLPSLPVAVSLAEIFHTSIDSLLNEESVSVNHGGELSEIINTLTDEQKMRLAKVLKGLLPYLKL